MTIIWMVTLYNYTLIQFLVNTFEKVYLNSVGASIADIIGYLIGGWCFYKVGLKGSLGASFALSAVGGTFVTAIGLRHETSWIFPVLVTLSKLGISIAYQIVYLANPSVFPTLFAATAFGLL